MGQVRRLVLTGVFQLAAFLFLVVYALLLVRSYYLRLTLFTAAVVDAVASVYFLLSISRERAAAGPVNVEG
jgi:hypothetical protein